MNNWKSFKIGDISDSCLGKMLDKNKNKGEFQPYLSNKAVRWGDFDLSNLSEMRFEPHEEERYGIRNGDLIVCEGGEPGRCAIWRSEVPIMKIQKALHRVRVNLGFNNEFLYYRLLLAGRNGELEKYFIGSTIKHLTGVNLKKIEFDFPSYEMQCAISKVLANLDSKIRLNNRINAELEVMAKTIYEYWFVQFDFPDKDGKPYKASGGKMLWSEELKREIPEGWEVDKLSSKLKIVSGFPFDSDTYVSIGQYKVITIKNVQQGKLDSTKVDFVNEIPKRLPDWAKLCDGDVLISLTGNVGRICLVAEENLLLNQRVGKFICASSIKAFFYFMFQRRDTQSSLEKLATGTSQKNLSPVDIGDMKVLFPENDILEKFDSIVTPCINRMIANHKENQKLTELRDWLLPMLMNGQIKIKDAERLSSEALAKGEELAMAAEPEEVYHKRKQ